MRNVYILIAFVAVLTLIYLVTLSSCAVQSDPDQSDVERLKAKAQSWCEQMEVTDVISKRCDRITFHSLRRVACPETTKTLGEFIYDGAAYHRDVDKCYPDSSRSECSPDGLITGLNATVRGRGWTGRELIGIRSYLTEHDYICGEGPESLTSVKHLAGQLQRVIDFTDHPGSRQVAGFVGEETDGSGASAAGLVPPHNQYLSFVYLQTDAIVRGRWTNADGVALRMLAASRPGSAPIAAAAGYGERAVDLLNQFPDEMPLGDGYDHWGSAPDAIMFVWAVSLLGE